MQDETAPSCSEVSLDALPYDLNYVPEKLKERAKSELSEDEETRTLSLELLRSMLKGESELRWQDDDLFLLAFLRVKKFDVRKAFNRIKGMYSIFGRHRDVFYDFKFDDIRKTLEENSSYFLTHRDSEGSVVILFRFSAWDHKAVSVEDHLLVGCIGLLDALRSPVTQIAGFKLIVDFKGFGLEQLLQLTPSRALFYTEVIQNSFPIRLQGIHTVNENHLFSYIWNLLKLFLSKKLRKRVHFHGGNIESLHKFFHPSILPAEMGGEGPSFNNADWRERIEASSDYINHVFSFGYEKYLKKSSEKKSRES